VGINMKKIIHFVVSKGDVQYVAECMELPIVTQGRTIDETVQNIKEALTLHLEGEDSF
jgi:predicted RNase H-like HicB family nuclease